MTIAILVAAGALILLGMALLGVLAVTLASGRFGQ